MSPDRREERDVAELAELGELFRSLDRPLPAVAVEDVVRRARRGPRAALRVAAVLAAVLGLAGIAYALPGSPVRPWAARWIGRAESPSRPGDGVMPRDAGPGAQGGGLLLDPAEPLLLRLRPGSTGHLRIRVTRAGALALRMTAGVGRFTSEPASLHVGLGAADTLELTVPADAGRVEVTHGGRVLFRKQGERVDAALPTLAEGIYGIDLGTAPP